MTTDEPTDEILRRVAPRNASAYIRAAVAEKAARDEHRGAMDELRARVAALEAEIAQLKQPRKTGVP